MFPYDSRPSLHHWHYGPSRIFWFFVGAATASWWINHREARFGPGAWGHCLRPPMPQPPVSQSHDSSASWSPRDIPRAINNIPPADFRDEQRNQTSTLSEEERRMKGLGHQAGNKMVELSEATLDTVLTTVEMLKAKLAEHRAERDKQLEEERKRNPPHSG